MTTIWPNAVCPLYILNSLDGRIALAVWPGLVVPAKWQHARIPLHIHTSLDGRFSVTDGPALGVPTKMPYVVYQLHIHTSLDEQYSTHSRASTRCDNNTATWRISIEHSH